MMIKLITVLFCFAAATATKEFNVSSSSCGGNCPEGCSTCPCGSTQDQQSIAFWCAQYSWNAANCECIMKHESGGNANAMYQNNDGSYDVGLWQIKQQYWSTCTSGGQAPCDPQYNYLCATQYYKRGGNTWKMWSSCSICGCCDSA